MAARAQARDRIELDPARRADRHSAGHLSVFAGGKYQGDNERVAREILRYRQHLNVQRELAMEAPEVPDYFETPTSRRSSRCCPGRTAAGSSVVATGPGCGKTKAAKNYRDAMSNVWMVTMAPSCSGINSMQIEVLAALGERDARGSMQQLSRRIRDRIRNTGGLLIFDEAQHLLDRTIDEIRSWHDDTGRRRRLPRQRDGAGADRGRAPPRRLRPALQPDRHAADPQPAAGRRRARAGRRLGGPRPKQVDFIVKKSQQPGGLRTVTMMLELATMVAASERRERELAHLQEAWAQLVSRPLAA
jgi:hypothetical protein